MCCAWAILNPLHHHGPNPNDLYLTETLQYPNLLLNASRSLQCCSNATSRLAAFRLKSISSDVEIACAVVSFLASFDCRLHGATFASVPEASWVPKKRREC